MNYITHYMFHHLLDIPVAYMFCQKPSVEHIIDDSFVITVPHFLQVIDLGIGLCVCSTEFVLIRIPLTKPVRYRYTLQMMKQSIHSEFSLNDSFRSIRLRSQKQI